jgi:hypothetical protein
VPVLARLGGDVAGEAAMWFSYRKSVQMGPFRVTASRSGASNSVGVTGAPITKRASGKAQAPLSVPGTGLPYTAAVTVHQGGTHIERTRAGMANGNHLSNISWRELVGIDFLDPGSFSNGHAHFATPDGPRGLTAAGNGSRLAASTQNPHAIMFAWYQALAYRPLRALPADNVPSRPPRQQLGLPRLGRHS